MLWCVFWTFWSRHVPQRPGGTFKNYFLTRNFACGSGDVLGYCDAEDIWQNTYCVSVLTTIWVAVRPGSCESVSLGLGIDHVAQNTRPRGGIDAIRWHPSPPVHCVLFRHFWNNFRNPNCYWWDLTQLAVYSEIIPATTCKISRKKIIFERATGPLRNVSTPKRPENASEHSTNHTYNIFKAQPERLKNKKVRANLARAFFVSTHGTMSWITYNLIYATVILPPTCLGGHRYSLILETARKQGD